MQICLFIFTDDFFQFFFTNADECFFHTFFGTVAVEFYRHLIHNLQIHIPQNHFQNVFGAFAHIQQVCHIRNGVQTLFQFGNHFFCCFGHQLNDKTTGTTDRCICFYQNAQTYRRRCLVRLCKIICQVFCDFAADQLDSTGIGFFQTDITDNAHVTFPNGTAYIQFAGIFAGDIHIRIEYIAFYMTVGVTGNHNAFQGTQAANLQCYQVFIAFEHAAHHRCRCEHSAQCRRSYGRSMVHFSCILYGFSCCCRKSTDTAVPCCCTNNIILHVVFPPFLTLPLLPQTQSAGNLLWGFPMYNHHTCLPA